MSTKRKFPAKLGQPAIKPSAKPTTKESLDDSGAVVLSGISSEKVDVNGTADTIEISSDSSSDEEDEEEEDDDEEADGSDEEEEAPLPEAPDDSDVDMQDANSQNQDAEDRNGDADETEAQGEPSFGDLVLANTAETIDVAGAFNDSNVYTLAYPHSNKLQPPSGVSLGTVLTQALKTNDLTLLESCLQTPDISTIRATIQRLDSPLAGILLQKIAERLHRRPGRAGSLMVWVQWTLVTHGGYLATQPDLIKKLAELNRVIDERARGLQSLLSLKGKLDMLEAQMQLRQSMRQQRRELDDEDDPGVIYVEGEEEESTSESEDGKEATGLANGKAKSQPTRRQENGNFSDNASEASEQMPNVTSNGAIADSDASDDESDDNLIDDEAEETDAESDDEDEVDHSDVDEMDEEDESDDAAPATAAPPTKMQKVGGLFSSKSKS